MTMDDLLVRVEYTRELMERGDAAVAQFRTRLAEALRKALGVRAEIETVPPASFPRTDFKARRVIDDRDLFRETVARLQST